MKIREFFTELPLDERIFRLETVILSGMYIVAKRQYKKLRKIHFGNADALCDGKFIYDIKTLHGEDVSKLALSERIELLPRIEKEEYQIMKYISVDESFYEIYAKFFENGGQSLIIYDKTTKANGYLLTDDLLSDIECKFAGLLPSQKRVDKDTPLDNWEYWEDERKKILIKDFLISDYVRGRALIPITKEYYERTPAGTRLKMPNGDYFDIKKIIKKESVVAKCLIVDNKIIHPFLPEEKNEVKH